MKTSIVAALLLLLALCSSVIFAIGNPAASPKSKLLLVGGNWSPDNDDIFNVMWQNAPVVTTTTTKTVSDDAQALSIIRIAIVTAASSDPDAAQYYKELFESKSNDRYRIETEWVPITMDTRENNKDPKVIQMLDRVNILFFSGGDQSVLLQCFTMVDDVRRELVDSPFLSRLKHLYRNSQVLVVGTSAGSAVMATKRSTMITGGESWQAVVHGAFEEGKTSIRNALTYNPYGGFGMFTLGLIDTHFSERGRQGRIVRLADHVKSPLAFGVDENSAIYVESVMTSDQIETAQLHIFGGVHLFNLTQGMQSPLRDRKFQSKHESMIRKQYGSRNNRKKDDDYWRIFNVKNAYFTSGDRVTITMNHRTGASLRHVQFASWKSSLWGREEPRAPYESKDIFSSPSDDDDDEKDKRKLPREYVAVAQDLVMTKLGNVTLSTTFENDPTTYAVMMNRIDYGPLKTIAMQGFYKNMPNGQSYTSYDFLLVDMFDWNY